MECENPLEEISFLVASPATALYDVNLIAEAATDALRVSEKKIINELLGYTENPGREQFRFELAKYLERSFTVPDDLCILPGASFAIQLLSSFSGEGKFVVESPTYFLALPMFNGEIESIEMDSEGIRVDILEEKLNAGLVIRILYIIPFYHNPTGITLSRERMKMLIELSKRHNFRIISDEVYAMLGFDSNNPVLPLVALDYEPYSVYSIGSFSKIFSPGFRTGWVHCKGKLNSQLVGCPLIESGGGFCAIESAILCSIFQQGKFEPHLAKALKFYESNASHMCNELRKWFPNDDVLKFKCPTGGYFIWIEMVNMPESECDAIFAELQEQSVVVLEGSRAFYKQSMQFNSRQYLRLSFSFLSPANISEGISRIAKVVLEHSKNRIC